MPNKPQPNKVIIHKSCGEVSKGQLISKCLFGVFNSPKKLEVLEVKFGLFEKGTKFEKIFHLIFDVAQ